MRVSISSAARCRAVFYLCCALLAAAAFYFTIAEALFAWFFPDEVNATNIVARNGFFGCIYHYYWFTTINRLTSAAGVCLMAKPSIMFDSPWIGWVIARFLGYIAAPSSLAFLLKKTFDLPVVLSAALAFFICTAAFYIISDSAFYMFGLDLAIYAFSAATFFMLIPLAERMADGAKNFGLFCVFFALNLNSHEVFLAISALFIPYYFLYHYIPSQRVVWSIPLGIILKRACTDKKLLILLAIYAISASFTLLAPGVAMRQQVWPSSGRFLEGVLYVVFASEEVLFFICRAYVLVIILFALGFCVRLQIPDRFKITSFGIWALILLAPLAYLGITAFLIGITPSLWVGGMRPEMFQITSRLLTDHAGVAFLAKFGGLAIRQNLFLYVGLLLDVFLLGFICAGRFSKASTARRSSLYLSLGGAVLAMALLHPDGRGALAMGGSLFHAREEKSPTGSVMQTLFPQSNAVRYLERGLYTRNKIPGYDLALEGMRLDQYFLAHRNKVIESGVQDDLKRLITEPYKVYFNTPWPEIIEKQYGIKPPVEDCAEFAILPADGAVCQYTKGNESAFSDLKTTSPQPITLSMAHGAELKSKESGCAVLEETAGVGEHYAAASVVLAKGLNYFVAETLPGDADIFLYFIGDKASTQFFWRMHQEVNPHKTGWLHNATEANFTPLFSQIENAPTRQRIKIVIDSAKDQTIQLRWQHARQDIGSVYEGDRNKKSAICGVYMGRMLPESQRFESLSGKKPLRRPGV